MERVSLQQPAPPLPPLLRPMRLAVPDYQGLDFPVESDCSPVSSDAESESDNCTDDEGGGNDSDLESDNPICEGVDFPDVLDAPLEKEEIESIEDKIEECVSNEDDNSTDDEGESSEGERVISRGSDYDSEVECNVPFWVTYFQQVDESERIDVKKQYKKYPGRRLLPSYPLRHYLRDRKKRRMLRGYAEGALKKYNDDKGTDYVFERVLKVKGYGCCDHMYFLIFLAKMGNGSRQFFQAMVVKDQKDNVDFPVVMSRGVDFPAVLDSLPVKEESDSSKDGGEDYVSNKDDSSTNDEDKVDISNLRIVESTDYDLELEHDKSMWESHFRQVYESKGFDIKDYPGSPPLPNFYPLPSYLRIRKKYRMLKGYAESALKRYLDDTGTNHVIEGILNVKRGGSRDYIYYLIFLAKTDDEERYYFQAMVIPDEDDNLDFLVVRKKAERRWRRCYWM